MTDIPVRGHMVWRGGGFPISQLRDLLQQNNFVLQQLHYFVIPGGKRC